MHPMIQLLAGQVATSTSGVDLLGPMADAFKGGQWGLAAGLLLTVLVALARWLRLTKLIPKKWDKWLAVGVAMVGSIATGLVAGQNWLAILSGGIAVGLTAIGGYETLGRMIRSWVADEDAQQPPPPPEPETDPGA